MSLNLRSLFLLCASLLLGVWYIVESYREHERFDYKILGENTILILDRRDQLFKLITPEGMETKRLTQKNKSNNRNFFNSLITKKSESSIEEEENDDE